MTKPKPKPKPACASCKARIAKGEFKFVVRGQAFHEQCLPGRPMTDREHA